MRYLLISDIHANLDALDVVLATASEAGYDRVLVLGDLVGYGAQPNEVVERIRSLEPYAVIRGNHDKVASGEDDSEGFNPIAQEAAAWTYQALTEQNRAYLSAVPAGPLIIDNALEICHGSPGDEDAYIASYPAARRALEQARVPVCFYGHTHIPVAFCLSQGGQCEPMDQVESGQGTLVLQPKARYLINPGSVGQPRDGDPRASFALFDSDQQKVDLYRVAYPVEHAQERIMEAGLPQALARRLALGR